MKRLKNTSGKLVTLHLHHNNEKLCSEKHICRSLPCGMWYHVILWLSIKLHDNTSKKTAISTITIVSTSNRKYRWVYQRQAYCKQWHNKKNYEASIYHPQNWNILLFQPQRICSRLPASTPNQCANQQFCEDYRHRQTSLLLTPIIIFTSNLQPMNLNAECVYFQIQSFLLSHVHYHKQTSIWHARPFTNNLRDQHMVK